MEKPKRLKNIVMFFGILMITASMLIACDKSGLQEVELADNYGLFISDGIAKDLPVTDIYREEIKDSIGKVYIENAGSSSNQNYTDDFKNSRIVNVVDLKNPFLLIRMEKDKRPNIIETEISYNGEGIEWS